MLELESVSWRNFMSYPDEVTTVPLSSLGQCLITGEVVEDDHRSDMSIKRSNGAGKSTIPNVIQWVLFGRTMHSAQPGDKVVNHFTKKDCWAKLTFKNGNSITRTRNVGGHNEIYFIKDGDEHSLVSDTQGTSKLQQAQLAREFNLDWEIFCGSVFFNQYGKSWMEMPDAARKKAIERILHVDKFIYRAQVAKKKFDGCKRHTESLQSDLELRKQEINRITNEINRLTEAKSSFSKNQKTRQVEMLTEAKEEKEKRDAISIPDADKLKARWDLVNKIEEKIEKLESAESKAKSSRFSAESKVDDNKRKIQLWEKKAGKVCLTCEQEVPDTHVKDKLAPYKEALAAAEKEAKEYLEIEAQKRKAAATARTLLSDKKPDMTMRDLENLRKEWDRHDKEFKRLKNRAVKITEEENPHIKSLSEAEKSLENCKSKIQEIEEDLERYDYQGRHYKYIHKAYHDRTKIKSYVFQEHIPFINSRLRHYLDVFGLDVRIELTPSLGIKSNMWGYEFESGGERKRTDVAFMFAIFDFHEQMYGRQSNILVLDEVDGRMDDDGIDALISIIKNDLATKVETILIISHRNMMFDVFAREIKVTRQNRVSQLQLL